MAEQNNMTTPNPYRGEVSVKLGGENIILVPSFSNIVAIEREANLGLIEMASLMQNNQLRIEAIVTVLKNCCQPQRDQKQIETLVESSGLAKSYEAVAYFFASAISAGSDDGGKRQANKPGKPRAKTAIATTQ
jgi:hypothetical protein